MHVYSTEVPIRKFEGMHPNDGKVVVDAFLGRHLACRRPPVPTLPAVVQPPPQTSDRFLARSLGTDLDLRAMHGACTCSLMKWGCDVGSGLTFIRPFLCVAGCPLLQALS
jgi:hypothetical protein